MAFGLALLMSLLRAVKLSLNSTSPKAHSEGDPYQSHLLGAIDRVGLISAACCLILIQTLEGLILYIAPLLWALSYFSSEHSRARLYRFYHTFFNGSYKEWRKLSVRTVSSNSAISQRSITDSPELYDTLYT
jgi:hypothetical protein